MLAAGLRAVADAAGRARGPRVRVARHRGDAARAHGLARSPLTAAIDERADARIVATLVDDPDAARFDTRPARRRSTVARGRTRVLVDRVG